MPLLTTFDNSGYFSTNIYDKRNNFDFNIRNSPYLCSNIPSSPAYGFYILQMIRYTRAITNYSDFLARQQNMRNKLRN